MCGILGSVVASNRELNLTDEQARAMLARLAYRGPDGEGLAREERVLLGHQRLAVRDLSDAGRQPMRSPDGRWTLVYNGELYDEPELRARLSASGRTFRTSCDSEALLAALERWGAGAVTRIRGMYAFAAYDAHEQRLVVARDPLGIKPVYWWCNGSELVFASSPAALFAHPRVSPVPNLHMISAYLTTIRTVIGRHTLFEGVHALEPGEVLELDLRGESLVPAQSFPHTAVPIDDGIDEACAVERVRETVCDSIQRHLRSDVPTAVLLSGGLDSTILTVRTALELTPVQTWSAGAATGEGGDLSAARAVSERIGTKHGEVRIDRGTFTRTWGTMIDALGVPLSTPNEVAIHSVSKALRADGQVVALSGEGADELFGGYADALIAAEAFEASRPEGLSPGRFQLETTAWVSPGDKPEVLREGLARALDFDRFVVQETEREFSRGTREAGYDATPLDAHLRFQRLRNLTGLLQRLDTATMLAGVEGRTPFADIEVLRLAESLPMHLKLESASCERGGSSVATSARLGKRVLRDAFRDQVPADVLSRAKTSFPLPFHRWLVDERDRLQASPFARELIRPEVIEVVAQDPEKNWAFAWPLMNIARWGDRWWG